MKVKLIGRAKQFTLAFCGVLATLGCALAQPVYSPQPPASARVVILKPVIGYEQLPGGTSASASRDLEAYSTRLGAGASAVVAARGMTAVEGVAPDSASDAASAEVRERLRSEAAKLARGVVGDEAKSVLARFGSDCPDCLVLVVYMKAKVGPQGSWNPNTGAITSKMDSLLLQASAIAAASGETVWKNEVYLRELPRPNQDKLLKSIGNLFVNFSVK
jgi:hypothetical protein